MCKIETMYTENQYRTDLLHWLSSQLRTEFTIELLVLKGLHSNKPAYFHPDHYDMQGLSKASTCATF